MIKQYYELTKPGIIYGNALVAAAGFVFAARGYVDWYTFVATLFGLSCIIGSACAFNNVYDRKIDAQMARTKKRPTVTGKIKPFYALLFAFVLGLLGSIVLAVAANGLAVAIALLGFMIYVFLYTPLKSKTPMALFVGALAGAAPPVVGYVAVTNVLDYTAGVLFTAMFLWQLPHFIAIAMYRYGEYAAAGVPLFIKREPSARAKRIARGVFYASLVVLLVASGGLMLHR